ncbi:MAG: nickel-type superoxide dismutase maturation protease [Leptolyngbya sp. SIO4C1]|nr:nickel-type superoxide dismutase maturation protease [Leptolyngbya sp. SIO4C1]
MSQLPDAGWQEYGYWLLRQRRLFQVVGASMQPTLNPGDRVLASCKSPDVLLQPGDLVIAQHPFKPNLRLIKRVSEIFYDGGCYLTSDNVSDPTAQDSRSFGIVGQDLIVGQVTSVFYRVS